jgi:hypothetical protein
MAKPGTPSMKDLANSKERAAARVRATMNRTLVEQLDEVEPRIRSLLEQIRPHVINDDYGVIVADDTSGRVPALIIRAAINKHRAARGLPKLALLFVPGHGGRQRHRNMPFESGMTRIEDRLIHDAGSKPVLLITDFIGTGDTVRHFVEKFRSLGLGVHCAALSSHRVDGLVDLVGMNAAAGDKLFVGGQGAIPGIDGNRRISGVRKAYNHERKGVYVERSGRHTVVAAREHGALMVKSLEAVLA